MNLSGNTVLITGGSSGIGLALAQAFADANNRVIITGRDAARLNQARQGQPHIETAQSDLRDTTALRQLVQTFPDVNILINNAGVQFNGALTDIASDAVETEIATNFTAPVVLTQAFLPMLLRQPSAAVVNIGSTLGIVAKQNAAVYCASKAALHSFSQTLRWQLEGTSVKVFEALPPLVDTPMTAGRDVAKVSAASVARAVLDGMSQDRFEMWIGPARGLRLLHAVLPFFARRMMRYS